MVKKFVCTIRMEMLAVMELGLVSIFHLNIFKREYFHIFLSFRCHCFPGGLSALGWRVLVSSNVLSENSSPLCYGRFWILRLVGFFFFSFLVSKWILIIISFYSMWKQHSGLSFMVLVSSTWLVNGLKHPPLLRQLLQEAICKLQLLFHFSLPLLG